VRWRIIDLCQWLWEEFQVSVSKQTLGRELRAMCYRKLSARPRHHAQTEGAIEAFEKTSLLPCRRLRTNGSCETIGSPIASLPATTTSSTTAATAWNKLVRQPWIIMSIGMRDWAHEF
jgi:hypothetical protein